MDPHGSLALLQANSIHICPDEHYGTGMCDTPYRSKGIYRGSWEHLINDLILDIQPHAPLQSLLDYITVDRIYINAYG